MKEKDKIKYPVLVSQLHTTGSDIKVKFDKTGFEQFDIIGHTKTSQQFFITDVDGAVVTMKPVFKKNQLEYDKSDLQPGFEFIVISMALGEYDPQVHPRNFISVRNVDHSMQTEEIAGDYKGKTTIRIKK